jgi:DNA repair protein RadC
MTTACSTESGTKIVKSIENAEHLINYNDEEKIIARAFQILESRVNKNTIFDSPDAVRKFLVLREASQKDQFIERFGVLFLDSQHRLIHCETMFTGTINQTSVYPREVVKAALNFNAAAVILTHNHPSGSIQPSSADHALTKTLKNALALIDVRVLDHIITTPTGKTYSFAEYGDI